MADPISDNKPQVEQTVPIVWLLTGHKAGDNNQVLALAEALQWPFEVKRFSYQRWELLTNRLLGATLAGIDRQASSLLVPPWPDLVITAGRRNEPVARWIRQQSGGRTRLVHIGRPWAPLDCYDLIVATPQYFLPPQHNVMMLDLPLHRIDRAGLDAVAAQWAGRFADLVRPYWSVMLGGDSGPFVFTPAKARLLANWTNARVRESGGSVLVTDSARTPDAAYAAFLDTLDTPRFAWQWQAGAKDNPYLALLALADRLVVTGESMSMLAEASVTDKPLYVYDLADCPPVQPVGQDNCRSWWRYPHNFRYKPLSHRLAMMLAPRRMRRDVSRIQAAIVDSGRAVWVGQTWVAGEREMPVSDSEQVAARVRDLFSGAV